MLKTLFRQSLRWQSVLNNSTRTIVCHSCKPSTASTAILSSQHAWPSMVIARRTSAIDQGVSDAAQMRTPTPLTPADIQRRVLRICQDYDRIEDAKKKNISLSSHFNNDLGLDSLDHVEMIVALENEFGFEIPDSDYEKLYTVQAVVDYLSKRMHVSEHPKHTVSSAYDPRQDHH